MARTTVSVDIPLPRQQVWNAISDLAGHAQWMSDVESIEFEGEPRHGVGTVMLVATRIGPFALLDRIEVTAWEPPARIGVRHDGLVKGEGEFRLDPIAGATRFSWNESLEFPPILGGPLAAWVAGPILASIWRRNLRRFASSLP